MRNFNEVFREAVPYDNIKSHKKSEFHPLFRRYIFQKTTGGDQIKLTPSPRPPIPAVLGLKKICKNYSKFVRLPGKIISFNHSASNCMKSLLMICSKSAKVTSKQCSGAILISLFFRIKLFKVIHSVERKNFWIF